MFVGSIKSSAGLTNDAHKSLIVSGHARLEIPRYWLATERSLSWTTGEHGWPRWLRKATAAGAQRKASLTGMRAQAPDLSSWRKFRAQLVNEEMASSAPLFGRQSVVSGPWCHRIPEAENGCLLLSNKPGMGFFERAVILVVEHTSIRSLGLMLNRQAGVQIQDLAVAHNISKVFGTSSLRLGGPHLPSNLHLLHGQQQVADAVMVCPGLYMGGLQASMKLALEGKCQCTDFSLLAGYTGWQSGQLKTEIRQGSWIPVSADPQTVLDIACREVACGTAWHDMFARISEVDRTYIEA